MREPILWGAEALWQQLEPLLPGLTVEVVAQTHSTNSALLERGRGAVRSNGDARDTDSRSGDAIVRRSVESAAFGRRAIDLQPGLLVAEHQTAGRGRQGRSWQSAAGASLTFSLALPLACADLSGLSLAVGVAIADALDPVATGTTDAHAGIALKWPNDLWWVDAAGAGRKLGGVLIETLAAGPQRLVVVGVGLNVRHFAADEVQTGFATLAEHAPDLTAPAVLARIALPLVEALKRFEHEGFAPFAERFAARDLLRGKEVDTTMADAPHGTACGVSPQGALLLRTADGVLPVTSGEVSVRLAAPASTAGIPSC